MNIREAALTESVLAQMIALSENWEAENSCYGYRRNERTDIEGNRIFLAEEDGTVIGYLFGQVHLSKNMHSIMPEQTPCFEVEELYVSPAFRSRGIGAALFRFAESVVQSEAEYMLLSTATKNWRTILHFYIDELDMNFWSARLFRKIGGASH